MPDKSGDDRVVNYRVSGWILLPMLTEFPIRQPSDIHPVPENDVEKNVEQLSKI